MSVVKVHYSLAVNNLKEPTGSPSDFGLHQTVFLDPGVAHTPTLLPLPAVVRGLGIAGRDTFSWTSAVRSDLSLGAADGGQGGVNQKRALPAAGGGQATLHATAMPAHLSDSSWRVGADGRSSHPIVNDDQINGPVLKAVDSPLQLSPVALRPLVDNEPLEVRVNQGDSLIKVARRHGVSPARLAAFNQLEPDRLNYLRTGVMLRVPAAGDVEHLNRLGLVDVYMEGLKKADQEYRQVQRKKREEQQKQADFVAFKKKLHADRMQKILADVRSVHWDTWAEQFDVQVRHRQPTPTADQSSMTHVSLPKPKGRVEQHAIEIAESVRSGVQNIFYWGKAIPKTGANIVGDLVSSAWTAAGAYADVTNPRVTTPTPDMVAVVQAAKDLTQGVKTVSTDFTGTVAKVSVALIHEWQAAQALRARGRIEEAAAREVDLLANVALGGVPFYYGLKTVGRLATVGAEVSGVDKVLRAPRELFHRAAAQVNDAVVRNKYSMMAINATGDVVKRAGHKVEDVVNSSKYVPERLKPKNRPNVEVAAAAPAASAASIREQPPGSWTLVRRGALATGAVETARQIFINEPIKVYESSAETVGQGDVYPMHFVRWNASPFADARIYQIGDLFHVMGWCIPLDVRPPWLSGADVTSLWYVRKSATGYSVADAPRIGGECAISFSFGDNNAWVGAQAIARPLNATSPTQVNFARGQNGFKVSDVTSQSSINGFYATVQSHAAAGPIQFVYRDILANGVASWQYPAAVGGKVFTPKNKNVPVDFFALMPNPGFGQASLTNGYIPSKLIYPATIFQNLLMGRPIAQDAVRPLPLADRSLAKVIRDGKLVPLEEDLGIVIDERGQARAVTVPELHKHYSGARLSELGSPAILLQKGDVDFLALDRSKVLVVNEHGKVRKLESTELLKFGEGGKLFAVNEHQLSLLISDASVSQFGRPAYLSTTPFGDISATSATWAGRTE